MAKMFMLAFLMVYFESSFGQCPNMKSLFYIKSGFYLQNHKSLGLLADSETACRIKCYIVDDCMSYNYNSGTKACEVNDSDDIQHPKDLIQRHGYMYVGTENDCKSKPCPVNITCKASVRVKGHRCINKEINYCNKSLGMEDGRIKDGDITASSFYTSCGAIACKPYKGRLNSDAAWVATTKSPNEYLQVDLLKKTKLTSIATQGFHHGSIGAFYTKEYKLKYSDNVASSFQDHGITFPGNTDANSVVKNSINPPIVARYVRVHSLAWKTGIALRIELYGCVSN